MFSSNHQRVAVLLFLGVGCSLTPLALAEQAVPIYSSSLRPELPLSVGRSKSVTSVAFSPDGKLLASGSADNTIKLWSANSDQPVATLLTLSVVKKQTLRARRPSLDTKARDLGAGATQLSGGEWLITTPEGWFDCSTKAARFIRWNVGGELFPAGRYYHRLRRHDLVQKVLRGEPVPTPDFN
jgi:WD40 repeat protein